MQKILDQIKKELPARMTPPKGVEIPQYNQGVIAAHNNYREKVLKIINQFKKK